MKPRLAVLAAFLILLPSLQAQEVKRPKLTTTDGTTFSNATVTATDIRGISITHDEGIARIEWSRIPADLKKALGYDPQKLAEQAKEAEASAKAKIPKPRIGATVEDFRRSAGAYIGDYEGPLGSTILMFRLDDYDIHATFWGGRCHQLIVMDSVMSEAPRSAARIIEGRQLIGQYDPFIKAVLEANAAGSDWKEVELLASKQRKWHRADGQITATYLPGIIELNTKQFSDATDAADAKQKKKALNGF